MYIPFKQRIIDAGGRFTGQREDYVTIPLEKLEKLIQREIEASKKECSHTPRNSKKDLVVIKV